MSRKGNCWDNAVAESFFSTLEFELDAGAAWRSADDAEPALFAFIESYYNAIRLHSGNDFRSPNKAGSDWRREAQAASPGCPSNRGKLNQMHEFAWRFMEQLGLHTHRNRIIHDRL